MENKIRTWPKNNNNSNGPIHCPQIGWDNACSGQDFLKNFNMKSLIKNMQFLTLPLPKDQKIASLTYNFKKGLWKDKLYLINFLECFEGVSRHINRGDPLDDCILGFSKCFWEYRSSPKISNQIHLSCDKKLGILVDWGQV